MNTMRIAICGNGKIAHEALFALQHVEGADVVAVCVRPQSIDKGRALCEEYHIGRLYTDYDEMLASADIDFVYVGIVNSMHYEYGMKALLAGKHVIMEKPFTATLQQAEELRQTAISRHLYLFEAVTLFYVDNYFHIKRHLPDIGPVRLVQSNYSQYSSRYDRYLDGEIAPVFDPKQAGGAMGDINVYNINLVVGLFGMPKEVIRRDNRGFNGVDTSGVALLVYDGFIATCCGAKDSASPGFAIIQGEKGYIHVKGIPSILEEIEVVTPGNSNNYSLPPMPHRMVPEFLEMVRMYHDNDYDAMVRHLDVTLDVMRVLTSPCS